MAVFCTPITPDYPWIDLKCLHQFSICLNCCMDKDIPFKWYIKKYSQYQLVYTHMQLSLIMYISTSCSHVAPTDCMGYWADMVCSIMGDELVFSVYIAWNSLCYSCFNLQCTKTYNIISGFLLLVVPKWSVCSTSLKTFCCVLFAFPTATHMKRATEKFRM